MTEERLVLAQSAAGACIPGRGRHRARRHLHAGLAGAHRGCRWDHPGAHCGVVYEFLHDRRVTVISAWQDRNAVGLAKRFYSRRNRQYRRCPHCVGCTAAGGSRSRPTAAPGPRHQTGSRQSRCPRPDLWVCRGYLGFGRIAAVDRRLSRVLYRGSGRCSRASLNHAGSRCADQFPRRPRRSSRQRAVDQASPRCCLTSPCSDSP